MNLNAAPRVAFLAACLWIPYVSRAAAPPARQVITHDSLWLMKRVSSPVVSPDAWLAKYLQGGTPPPAAAP